MGCSIQFFAGPFKTLSRLIDVCAESEISFLEEEILSAITKSLALRGGPTGMTCDLTNSLGAHPGPVCSKHRCDGKNFQRTFCVNGLNYEGGDTLCIEVKPVKFEILTYSCILHFLIKERGKSGISSTLI